MGKWILIGVLVAAALYAKVSTGFTMSPMDVLIAVVVYFGWSIEEKLDKLDKG